MACPSCADIEEAPEDVPHVIRTCAECGREMRVRELGEDGKGIKVQAGDRFVIPGGWLTLAANPLKGTGRFTRAGIEWFAKLIFINDLPSKESDYAAKAEALEDQMGDLVNESPLIAPLDVSDEDDIDEIVEMLKSNPNTTEYWAFWTGIFLAVARDAMEDGAAERAAWASASAERCHAMVVFKEHLEEVVWMGHSARRVVDALNIWDANSARDDESFWQATFSEHSYVLSQVFAVPVVFIEERAYVGGMEVDRTGAKFVDYLLSAESSRETILVEIKTPSTRLLGGKYREGTYGPSSKLAGAITQVLTQQSELVSTLSKSEDSDLQAFRPKCVLIAGNSSKQLDDKSKRRSFELFRASSDVEIITYDELFRKVEILAELFSLKRDEGDGDEADAPAAAEFG